MYLIKNAVRCISRSKGRNLLIALIVLVIGVSACIGLSIRQASENTRTAMLQDLTVTATISFDRQGAMDSFRGQTPPEGEEGQKPSFDRDGFREMMGQSSSLTLEEYQTYAQASTVKEFYWTLTVSANGSDSLEPVSATDQDSSQTGAGGIGGGEGIPNRGGGGGKGFFTQGDFQLVGYSSESAMTSFVRGSASMTEGEVFEEGTEKWDCIISQELASYNDLSVGEKIVITSPENEAETYTLTVTGIFSDSSANEIGFSMGGFSATDPANQIYLSYPALAGIVAASETANTAAEGEEAAYSPLSGALSGTYVFSSVEDYETFCEEVRDLGLSDSYTVASQDITSYENSLAPLESLSQMAGWFLVVILVIGAIILIVFNIFNVRERKYEIGVLCAMGMKKWKVAVQMLVEIFIVTLCAVIVGAVIGGVLAVPVTNALLENQTQAQAENEQKVEMNFGRPGEGEEMTPPGGMDGFGGMQRPENMDQMLQLGAHYITSIDSAMNFEVVLQMLFIAILLTLAGGAVSMLWIMRYDPLKILSNRD